MFSTLSRSTWINPLWDLIFSFFLLSLNKPEIVPENFNEKLSVSVIKVKNPKLAFAKIAEKLGLLHTRILAPKSGLPETGAGLLGELPEPLSEPAFLQAVKTAFRAGVVRHTALLERPVRRVAVCGGSGSFLLAEARRAGADAFVTADFKYHEFFDADGEILIADIGHYESEQFTIELLFGIVREKFPTFALHCTNLNTNPVCYL